jgi:hypothetical protein
MFYFIVRRRMMENSQRRFVGLDLAKRTVEVCILCEGERAQGMSRVRTDEKGRERPASLLRKDDVVGMESLFHRLFTRPLSAGYGELRRLHPQSGKTGMGIFCREGTGP